MSKIVGRRYDPKNALFPYGRCACDGSMCCGGRGPAVYQVVRNGKTIRLCTKCDLSSDSDKTLLVRKTDKTAKILMDFDALGAFCIVNDLASP